jgi:hypothetical protein
MRWGIRTYRAGELLFGGVTITQYFFVFIRFFFFLFVIHQVSLVTCTAMEVYSQVAGEAVSS